MPEPHVCDPGGGVVVVAGQPGGVGERAELDFRGDLPAAGQGDRDVAALRKRGVPVAYLLFPGESHGFRKPENTTRALQAELSFYGQVFGFIPADSLPPLKVEGLSTD